MTEDEAKTKVCCGPAHTGHVANGDTRVRCIGSECMAWRFDRANPQHDAHGYCGLAGAPQ